MRLEVSPILKYLVSVVDHLASPALLLGIILSFASGGGQIRRRMVRFGAVSGLILGCVVFGVRLWDPKGTNLILISFNRWLVVAIAAAAALSALLALPALIFRRRDDGPSLSLTFLLSVLALLALTHVTPSVLQFTREFVYFGESGISTNALLRALGFSLGIIVCLLLCLSANEVHSALPPRVGEGFLVLSVGVFFLGYGTMAVAALQRLKVIRLTDLVFQVMIFGDAHPDAFLFLQLALAVAMLTWVVATHRRPLGTYPNRALLRKEKARLRSCRRWSWSLLLWCATAVFIVVVLRYYDTRPPAEVQPEEYTLEDGVITIPLNQVDDGHLHKFSYHTPNGFDVRFLVVKKPVGGAYGVGLDACEICGIAGYYERGEEEVVCRRCDVVMNKNTIGFHGGCNPIPFPYEIRESKIFIDVRDLERHEKRFK